MGLLGGGGGRGRAGGAQSCCKTSPGTAWVLIRDTSPACESAQRDKSRGGARSKGDGEHVLATRDAGISPSLSQQDACLSTCHCCWRGSCSRFVACLLNVLATCWCISWTDLLKQLCCHTELEVADESISPSDIILTPGQPVLALTLES